MNVEHQIMFVDEEIKLLEHIKDYRWSGLDDFEKSLWVQRIEFKKIELMALESVAGKYNLR